MKNTSRLKLFFVLCVVAISQNIPSAFAQEIEWQNTIGGSGTDALSCIKSTTDGGFIIGGYSYSDSSGDKSENNHGNSGTSDYWIVKVDSIGNIQWENTIGGNDDDVLYLVQQTMDGGYILGGSSKSNITGDKTENCIGQLDYWIVKVDAVGNIQWENTIGGTIVDDLRAIQQTLDGGYILGGMSNSNISGDKTENTNGDYDFWIVKTDALGNIQWQNSIGGDTTDVISCVQQTLDGGYIIGGCSNSNVSGDKTENCNGLYDYWIVKTDALGNIQWQNTISGNGDDRITSIQQTTDGGYMLGGFSDSNISGDKTENSHAGYDFWIVKTDSTGNIQWQNTLGGTGWDYPNNFQQTNDGGYVLFGCSSSNISGDKTENSWPYDSDYWIIKIDSTGGIEWQNTIGGDNHDPARDIQLTVDGGFIIGGHSGSNISKDKTENCGGGGDYWIVKLTDKYNSVTGKCFVDANSNYVQDAGELSLANKKINENNTSRFAFTNVAGEYLVSVLEPGNFTVTTPAINYYNTVPVTHSAIFTGIHQTDSLNDFAFQPAGVFNDVCATITPLENFRTGVNASYMIDYGNYGTTTIVPTIIFFIDTNVSYVSANLTPISVTPDSVVWALPSLNPFQKGNIVITVNLDTGLSIGTLINSSVLMEPVAGDANPGCNFSSSLDSSIGSFDPNDILVSEYALTTTQLATPPFLDYIIRFQNTGNDTAFALKVLNPIDTNKLDLNSFEFVNSSHPVNLNWINYQRNMEFKFDNILLPDSNINEPMSHGFVHYRIKPKTTLLAGDSVTNNAYIYFDFNNPVATNTAVTHIVLPTSIYDLGFTNYDLKVYPNPTKDEITIQLNQPLPSGQAGNYTNQPITFKVFDVFGKEVVSQIVNRKSQIVNVQGLVPGVYFVRVGNMHARFVKQ